MNVSMDDTEWLWIMGGARIWGLFPEFTQWVIQGAVVGIEKSKVETRIVNLILSVL